MDDDEIVSVARALVGADHAVALTGAGVSTASGIPDFRGDGGLWERYDENDFHVQRFRANPGPFWTDWVDLHAELAGDADPNAAHESLADLEARGDLDAVVTQNVDGLHQRAGSGRVVELHGNGDRAVCRNCDATVDANEVIARVRDGETPPRCDCGGIFKPDTVLFGERLPETALSAAQMHARRCDVMVVAGTSLTVEPSASMPRRAAERGATLAVVNDEPTSAANRADYVFRGDVTDVLPAIRDAIDGDSDDGGAIR
ncbi:Sir2 family NAD-dependent protein deacetylase [Halostella sp. PRR32]|uniref:Sir2 family NAD-dependent protein deacetylase n=1 Tax=Halostella sp. PRR32 TaxID=3098147 RepID=UPI002B1DA7C9|nr:Sir2 family NAD-dependent protein deacetylase [Halostella sp. PRR32]